MTTGNDRAPRAAVLEARRPEELARLLQHHGIEVYHAPAMREEPVPDLAAVGRLIDRMTGSEVHALILLTGVGTTALLEAARQLGRDAELAAALGRLTIVARGPKPVAALRAVGLSPTVTVPSPYTTPEILETLQDHDLAGHAVAVQLAGEPNEELRRGLEQRGAYVDELILYRWALPEDQAPLERLLIELAAGSIDVVVVTSSAQVHNLFAVAARHGGIEALRDSLASTLAASVGPVCTRTLRNHGVTAGVEATPPKMGPLAAAIAASLGMQRST